MILEVDVAWKKWKKILNICWKDNKIVYALGRIRNNYYKTYVFFLLDQKKFYRKLFSEIVETTKKLT